MTIDGLQNFRDTGGTPLTQGGASRSGVLFRSEALSNLTRQGIKDLAATDIGVIADFRTPQERDMAPDLLPQSREFRIVELPLLEGAMTGMAQGVMKASDPDAAAAAIQQALATLPSLGDLYIHMLEGGAGSFAELARLVAASTEKPPTAVLVHCTAGKDRTGVAVALLLESVGADREAVIADYASSADNLSGPWAERMRGMVTAMGVPLTPEIDALLTATPPDALRHALEWVDSAHGGAPGYLQSGGLTDDELAALRARLAG